MAVAATVEAGQRARVGAYLRPTAGYQRIDAIGGDVDHGFVLGMNGELSVLFDTSKKNRDPE